MKRYFDAAASSPLDPRVIVEMEKHFEKFGNNNSHHVRGFEAQKVIDDSLSKIADLLGVSPAELAITYAGTDANRRFLWACARRFGWENIFCSAVEHSSIGDEILSGNKFDPRGGGSELSHKNPVVLAQMKANAEIGEIFDGFALRENFPNAVILEDWAQAVGKGLKFETAADAVSFSPQKLYGPKMIGLLWMKNPQDFSEISRDSHTKNCWIIAGMAKAFEIAITEQDATVSKLNRWTKKIESAIAQIPDSKIHSADRPRVTGTISAAFCGIRGAAMMSILSQKEGICVSTGSACTSDILVPTTTISHIEKDSAWQFPIRISLHKFLDDDAVDEFCEILTHHVSEFRNR
ncbi:aminotransferase class V-fold PLP-dependent enzyme [bacterium]|jgi:cysteine desulfurase|nr:aminotransferase class V-fold PLP-dependent enzyme [bacterium]MBT6832173.1 aminotransferase class V-fold PLP-dependent enzyme [bacterium]MBT6996381.1 aminotransferase class V-fold PLP-dependent enzyme [bacterium]MBT7772116.1 aminotransferase class V-fold PLP-dependent enzyme [bacterium]